MISFQPVDGGSLPLANFDDLVLVVASWGNVGQPDNMPPRILHVFLISCQNLIAFESKEKVGMIGMYVMLSPNWGIASSRCQSPLVDLSNAHQPADSCQEGLVDGERDNVNNLFAFFVFLCTVWSSLAKQKSKRGDISLFLSHLEAPPLSSHSGSHNLHPPSNLLLRPTNKVSNATFYAPRVRTHSELQHICLHYFPNIRFVKRVKWNTPVYLCIQSTFWIYLFYWRKYCEYMFC